MAEVERLSLRHPGGTTRIFIGREVFEPARQVVGPWLEGRSTFVVTTPRVRELHGGSLERLLASASRVHVLEVAEGEAAKRLEVAGELWEKMLAAGGKRDSRLIAMGGGSVGDIGGFVAGCFLRGIEYVQIPTTLLAQVDAAIGGKTAVDLGATKNSVGVFHHPAAVLSEIDFLATLPDGEVRAALAEVIKMALLLDPLLLERVERELPALLDGAPEALAPMVVAAAKAKARLVERDPAESDERRMLNFGHTLGHAIEAELGYEQLRHGEAVAYGMLFALRLARRRGFERSLADRFRKLVERLAPPPLPPLSVPGLLAAMARDKKGGEGGLAWVLPEKLGEGQIARDVGAEELADELAAFLADPWTVV